MSGPARSGGDFHVTGARPMLPTRGFPGASRNNVNGLQGTDVPAGMRKLTAAEKAVNETWSWSPDLGTYVCASFPQGIEP